MVLPLLIQERLYEPRCEKTGFLHMRKQRRTSAAQLISAFVFAIRIVQSLYYLNPKFQDSSHLLWLYSPGCIRPGGKPRRPVFSERGSYAIYYAAKSWALISGLACSDVQLIVVFPISPYKNQVFSCGSSYHAFDLKAL